MREAPSLIGLLPRIAPRPVLLIAGGVGAPDEIPANRAYRDAGGPTTQLWELADAGHTGGLRTHPAAVRAAHHRIPRPGPRAQGDLMTSLRHAALLIGVPLAFSVLLWFHPMVGDYEGLRDVTTRFQVVHVGMVLALPLLALGDVRAARRASRPGGRRRAASP